MSPWLNCPQISQPPWHSPVLRGVCYWEFCNREPTAAIIFSKVVLHPMQTATKPLLISVFGGGKGLHVGHVRSCIRLCICATQVPVWQ